MPNILFLSNNDLFQEDLISQIKNELSEDYKIFTQDEPETVFDVALLDSSLFLPRLRESHPKVPALILIASNENESSASDLESFIYKPFILSSLLNQIKATINVFKNSDAGILSFGFYELHPQDKEIVNLKTKKVIKLTEKEVNIIQYLYKAQGPVSKTELLENVWEYSTEVTTHTIETHIYRLRKKVETSANAPQLIFAEEGCYRLAD